VVVLVILLINVPIRISKVINSETLRRKRKIKRVKETKRNSSRKKFADEGHAAKQHQNIG